MSAVMVGLETDQIYAREQLMSFVRCRSKYKSWLPDERMPCSNLPRTGKILYSSEVGKGVCKKNPMRLVTPRSRSSASRRKRESAEIAEKREDMRR